MILSPMNVELTKVHYYESFHKHRNRNANPCIEITDNKININIKRNIFGQKSWTFNVNHCERNNKPKNKWQTKYKLTFVALSCTILAVVVALFCYLHNTKNYGKVVTYKQRERHFIFDRKELNVENILRYQLEEEKRKRINGKQKIKANICQCKSNEVCLRRKRAPPECALAKDARDPSGCGGLCGLNSQHCRLLDKTHQVFECVDNKDELKCPFGYYNCGELCIHEERLCDGSIDCANMSDELNCTCNLETHFQCGNNTSCLLKTRKCNGIVDCWDTSDENNCPSRFQCPSEQLACVNNKECFQRDQFCDGNFDCADKSDEICS